MELQLRLKSKAREMQAAMGSKIVEAKAAYQGVPLTAAETVAAAADAADAAGAA
eukprot:SAG22_NODE_3163_length_1888_cov_1.853549_1_plen_53_part_10